MKKETKTTKPEGPDQARRVEAGIFLPPPPPSKGRVMGLDCHPDTHTAAMFKGTTVYDAGQLQAMGGMSPEGFPAWAEKNPTRNGLVLVEAGSDSFDIYRRLATPGLGSPVPESFHVGRHAGSCADNDAIAAKRIAMVFPGTRRPCVWVPDGQTCRRRELPHPHNRALKQDTESGNALKGCPNQHTVRPGKHSVYSGKTHGWIMGRRNWSGLQRDIPTDHSEQAGAARQRRRQALRPIATEAGKDVHMLALMGLPGTGLVNAFALVATTGEVGRLASPRKLAAYPGLNPGQRESAKGKDIRLGAGRRGCKTMRALPIQAAHAVLGSGRHPAPGRWGWKLSARKGHRNIAVAAMARKLPAQARHLLSGNTPDKPEEGKPRQLRFRKVLSLTGRPPREKLNYPPRIDECVAQFEAMVASFQPFPQKT